MTVAPRIRIPRAVVGGALFLPPGDPHADAVTAALAVPNPAHREWVKRFDRLGRGAGPEPPARISPVLRLPDGPWAGAVAIPRCAPVAVDDRVDRRVFPAADPVALAPGLRLRRDQVQAVGDVLSAGGGQVVVPCGGGKTTIAMGIIARYATPALVLVPTLDLVRQWRDRARAQLQDVSVGVVADGERQDDRRVVIATPQTLVRTPFAERHRWGSRFGLILVDEVHRVGAPLLLEVVGSLPGEVRVGLTATEERHDGLTDFVWWAVGPVVYRASARDLEAVGATLRPRIRVIDTGYRPPDTEYAHVRARHLSENSDRNALLLRLAADVVRSGRQVLVLLDRVEHCRVIAEELVRRGVVADVLVGARTSRQRQAVIEGLGTGRVRVVTATTVADEGLDVPSLDAVILGCPSGNVGRVQQRVGRALRPAPGKPQPEVIDLVDDWPPYRAYAHRRMRMYRAQGWFDERRAA